jgi:transcriptional regulator with XRE-family HTH domain
MPTQFDRKSLRKLRKRAGLSQSEVARRIGVTSEMVCRLEGGTARPSIQTLAKLADLFGVTWSRFSRKVAADDSTSAAHPMADAA